MDKYTKRQYQYLRKQGYRANDALDYARVLDLWNNQPEDAEGNELMQLQWEPEPDIDLSWLEQDCFTVGDRRRTIEQVERDGCWIILGQVFDPSYQRWETVVSLGQVIGAPTEATLDEQLSVMQQTISAYIALFDKDRRVRERRKPQQDKFISWHTYKLTMSKAALNVMHNAPELHTLDEQQFILAKVEFHRDCIKLLRKYRQ